MAEVTGLVIGGVAMAGLFDTAMSTFERLDAGKNCGRDYQEAALSIALLGNRLHRWEELYRLNGPSSEPRDGYLAEAALKSVNTLLARVCKTAERYEPRENLNGIASVTDKVQNLTLGKSRTRLGAKIVWALRDKDRVTEVIYGIRARIEDLENLSEALVPEIAARAEKDFDGLFDDSSIEEPQKTIPAVKTVAAKYDSAFDKAVSEATGHKYDNVVAYEKGEVNNGDCVAEGYDGRFLPQKHDYKNITVKGNAKVNNGNMYGMSVFDS